MALHVFVAMPFGTKEGIDFNRVYADFIRPALESAGFEAFRADEETRAGNIRTDMFQELLLADLVVVNLSIDNPNVWYELGVRHTLRARGVLQIQCQRDYLPFDVYVDRTLRYHIRDGAPDPDQLESDKEELARFANQTIESWEGRRISPVYHLLPYLEEPDWKSLKVGDINEHWQALEQWKNRVEVARRRGRPGDIVVLAGEAPTQVLRLEAYRAAGQALIQLRQFGFAREQFDQALAIDHDDLESRRGKGIALGRLGEREDAEVTLKAVLQDHPDDTETWALLARLEKEAWLASWRGKEKTPEQMRAEAAGQQGRLRESIDAYETGFQLDPRNYYPGVNALTLMHLHQDLVGTTQWATDQPVLEGGIRWAVKCALAKDRDDYWARVTLAELEVLSGSSDSVRARYDDAIAVGEGNWFALDSSRQQLCILKDVGFRPEQVNTALELFDRELARLKGPTHGAAQVPTSWTPRRVFLFSGHMIDADDREEPRFPEGQIATARQAIEAKLQALGATSEDLALCGGACGGDLLFAKACLDRGLFVRIHLPFDEPEFLQESVAFAGDEWTDLFFTVKEGPNSCLTVAPQELGPPPRGSHPYRRNNLWQLYTALSWGTERLSFLCLWNRKPGDNPGGTEDMYDAVRKRTGRVYVLDTTKLWPEALRSR